MANSVWSILVGVEFDTKQIAKQLQTKLNNLSKNMKLPQKSAEDLGVTFNAANEVFRTSIDIISNMTSEVYKLDEALIEFQKVSDLSGRALDSYVDTLSEMGEEVARTTSEMLEAAT